MSGPISRIDSLLSSIWALTNLESIPWRGMLASMDPSRDREIPVATSEGNDVNSSLDSSASTFPRPSNMSLNASLRPSQSSIPYSIEDSGSVAVICRFREIVYHGAFFSGIQ